MAEQEYNPTTDENDKDFVERLTEEFKNETREQRLTRTGYVEVIAYMAKQISEPDSLRMLGIEELRWIDEHFCEINDFLNKRRKLSIRAEMMARHNEYDGEIPKGLVEAIMSGQV